MQAEASLEFGDVFESKDPRDTDPSYPLRRVKVTTVYVTNGRITKVTITNLSTGRQTLVRPSYLLSRRWRKVAE